MGETVISKTGNNWFFDFEMSTPWEQLSTGVFIVPEGINQQGSPELDMVH